ASDAANFAPGDTVTVEGTTERVVLVKVSGAVLTASTALSGTFDNTKFVRIADMAPGQTRFRLTATTGIEPGSVLHLAQNGTAEDHPVAPVSNGFVTLDSPGLTTGFKISSADKDVAASTLEFTLTFAKSETTTQAFTNLSMDPRHSRFFNKVVNAPVGG